MSRTSAVLAFVLVALVARTTGTRYKPIAPGRLPGDTEPIAYGLRLVPRYEKSGDRYMVHGQVEILIKVNRITPNITMHATDMQVTSTAVTDVKSAQDLPVDSHQIDRNKEQLVIYMTRNLLVNRQYEVKITFRTFLRNDMTGLYQSTYIVNNVDMWMAVSQFKPTYARRTFPCYDEPGYKTPFNISLGRQINQMTLSNSRFVFTQKMDYYGIWLDHYQPTKPISTYMVGVLVGNLKKSVLTSTDTSRSIYTYDDFLTQTRYALEETPPLYEKMENYTEVNGEFNKMDFLALPDFDPDGGENWGLNSYRERYVLFDNETKTKFKERSTMVIGQQQYHQWFGNLVTHSWWSDLWISQGFARYFQYYITNLIKWDWRLESLFVIEQFQTAMAFDQTPRHPMAGPVNGSSDIQMLFNPITNNKAAAIIRMIKHTVTEDRFKVPLKLFLNKYKYGVASSADLWSEFENYYFEHGFELKENVPFTNFVTSWTKQLGYPMINVTYNTTWNRFEITQTRFSIWPLKEAQSGQWYIGLTYTNDNQHNFKDLSPIKWMHPNDDLTFMLNQNKPNWYIFNIQSTGFYRVNYDQNNWKELIKQLNVSCCEIHVLNRAQLIDDSFNLARAGILKYSTALDLSRYLIYEEDNIPWLTAVECLTYVVERMRRSTEGYEYIKSYVRNLAETIYNKTEVSMLKYKSEDHTTLTSWNKFSVWACSLDSKYCTKNAMENFKKWSKDEKISPDIKDAALCTGIKLNDDENTWRGVLKVYTETQSASEKNSAQSGLACSKNTTILYKYLDFLSNDTKSVVRIQDFKDICDAMSLTPQGIEALTNYLILNMQRVLRYIPTGESIVTYMYSVLASKVALDNEILKLYNLKKILELPPKVKESFEESYKHVEQNLRWYNTYHVGINEWLGAPIEPETTTAAFLYTTTKTETTVTSNIRPITTEPPTTRYPTTEPQTTGPPMARPTTTGSPMTGPPTTGPPTTGPPTTGPPTTGPPTTGPPTTGPPTTGPPTTGTSTTVPPTTVPPNTVPPTTVPPTAGPPTAGPPTTVPPTTVSPTTVPPTTVPPTTVPPTIVPPTTVPPTTGPPTTGPLATGPPTTGPPTIGPSTTGPLTTGSTTTGTSTTVPPTTVPLTTGPPTTGTPTTGPPTTVPPTTVPPTAEPPTAGPPTTGPPTTVLPTTVPPTTVPPTIVPPTTVPPTTGPPMTGHPKVEPESIKPETSLQPLTDPATTVLSTAAQMFDFDNPTMSSINKCPDKSGAQSSWRSSFALLILVPVLIISSSVKLIFQ